MSVPLAAAVLLLILVSTPRADCGEPWKLPPYVYTSMNYTTRIIDPVELDHRLITGVDTLLRASSWPHHSTAAPALRRQPTVGRARVLLVVTTSNVWDRTFGLLMSLANVPDEFDMLVVDECSTDATREELSKLPRVKVLYVNETKGVTFHWNLAYEYFLDNGYEHMFISNNDVLIPPGAITKLAEALEGGECDLVSPMSTVNGKGHIGIMEGIEMVFNLSEPAVQTVMDPYNYGRVQAVLDATLQPTDKQVFPRRGDFNGYFFAMSRRIAKAAAGPRNLFSDQLFSFRQEHDLSGRMDALGMKRCLHVGTFVYHYKASTIPQAHLSVRETFKAACDVFHELQQQRRLQHSRPGHNRLLEPGPN